MGFFAMCSFYTVQC